MPARMNCGHYYVEERELFHSESFIKVFALYVFSNRFVTDWSAILFGSTKVHPGSMVVFVINNVHLIVSEIVFIFLFLLDFASFKNNNLILAFFYRFFLYLFDWFFLNIFIESTPAEVILEKKVLLMLAKIFRAVIRVERGFPLPICTNFDQMISGQLELVGGKLSVFLENILLRGRTQFFADFLSHVVSEILGHIPIVHV